MHIAEYPELHEMCVQAIPDDVIAIAKSAEFTSDDLKAIWHNDTSYSNELEASPTTEILRRLKGHFHHDSNNVKQYLRDFLRVVKRARGVLEDLVVEHAKDKHVDKSFLLRIVGNKKQE